MNKLSAPLQGCVDYMKEHQNKLYRFRGGNWGCEHCWRHGKRSYSTVTVDRLLKQGIVETTEWRRTPEGINYPGEVTLRS